jgi:predicted GIY-YIG superfamily endonuclease
VPRTILVIGMYYVYLLSDPDTGDIYVGYSADLKTRIREHDRNEHPGWKLVYYEAYLAESAARKRERKIKHHGNAMRQIKERIEASLEISRQNGAGSQ